MTPRRSFLRRAARFLMWTAAALAVVAGVVVGRAEWAHRRGEAIVPWSPTADVVDTRRGDDDQRPVLILLHGAALNGPSWLPFVRALGGEFRVIAPDLPGHGARRGERFTLPSAVATVQAVAASVAPAPVILVGDSLGGYTAMEAAAHVPPEQLRGIVVGGASADWSHVQTLHWARDVVMLGALLAAVDEDEFAAKALEKYGVPEADREPTLAAGVNLGAVSVAARTLLYGQYRAKVQALKVPVLIVNGDGDTRAMVQHDAFVAAAEAGEGYVFVDAMHGLSLHHPAEFAAVVEDFARRAVLAAPPNPTPPATREESP